jgi:hypothetical protein
MIWVIDDDDNRVYVTLYDDPKYLPIPPVQLPQRTYKSVVSAAQGRIAISLQAFQPTVVVERKVSACGQYWISQVLLGP